MIILIIIILIWHTNLIYIVIHILEFPAPKKLTTRNAVRDKQTILSPFIELTN